MRFGVKLYIFSDFILSDYRKHFLSLIKEAIKKEDRELFLKYYGNKSKNSAKPFTFSVSFVPDESKNEQGKIFLKSNFVNFYFSSFFPEDLIIVYNGLRKMKNLELPYLGAKVKIVNIFYKNQKKINDNIQIFKTLSPILVRKIEDKKGKGFIEANHPEFDENLFFNVKSLAKKFLNYDLKRENFQILDKKFIPKKVSLYGGEIANKGIITIKAPLKILQLIYDAGIGAKRSQGFGMLEVV